MQWVKTLISKIIKEKRSPAPGEGILPCSFPGQTAFLFTERKKTKTKTCWSLQVLSSFWPPLLTHILLFHQKNLALSLCFKICFYFHMWLFAWTMSICRIHVLPMEARRGNQVPEAAANHTVWVLGTESGSSARTTSALDCPISCLVCSHCHWTYLSSVTSPLIISRP